jgi:hypothetical protein
MEVFGDTFIPRELTDVRFGARHCPRCVWPYLSLVRSLDEARWLCRSCGHCWRIDNGRLRPVDPISCHGCAARSKHDCITLLQHDFPRFGAGTDTEDELAYT